ncbi:hypothetical protein [Methylocella sp.]|uniref:hypothetical protein n=1 Tax=Methylocella sp. TaxID=1978226 RepID=UPI003784C8E8
MSALRMFIPINKVDAARRLVYGLATAEIEDRSGEICDYATTKPLYEKWSQEIERSSGGRSFGNLRAMHGKVAAGKIVEIHFNDDARQIEICAKVVDDAEWAKVAEGVYTGFSQGGAYVARWTDDDGLTRYTAEPSEISLVDLPCLPQARFELVKTDGTRELRRFRADAKSDPAQDVVGRLEAAEAALADDDGEPLSRAELIALCRDAARALRAPRGTQELARAAPGEATTRPVGLEKRFDALAATLDDMLERVRRIEAQPLPAPFAGPLRAIEKHEDGAPEADPVQKLLSDPAQLSVLAIKLAHRNGRAPFG